MKLNPAVAPFGFFPATLAPACLISAFVISAFVISAGLISAFAAEAAPADELEVLIDSVDEDYLRRHPSAAIARGDKRYLDRFEEDLTAAYLTEGRQLNRQYLQRLEAINRLELSQEDRLSFDILGWELENTRRLLAVPVAEYFQRTPLNHMFGPHLSFARDMQWASRYPFNTVEDYERAIQRMDGFSNWIDQAIRKMREGVTLDMLLPEIVAENLIAQVTPLADTEIDASDFLGPVANMPETIAPQDRERIARAYRDGLEESVRPAYARLRDFLRDEYLVQASSSIGLSAAPNGRQIYLSLVESETTLALSPDQIHALGLEEIARIEMEMENTKNEAEFLGTLDAFRNFLRDDSRFKFASEDAMHAEFERVRSVVEDNLDSLFEKSPSSALEFRFVEDYAAPTAAAAYYSPPTPDGSRAGIVYLNAYDLPSRPSYTSDALQLHEGIPGHHFALSLAIENESLPNFRRFGGPTAYHEGWGLYAETLGDDLGLYETPYRKFGRLSLEAWRASRLVIDTGIHWYGWTRDESIEFLLAHTALSETDVIAEVERYIAIPAQALSYKIGQLKLLELRERAEEELGDAFDIRAFHSAILNDGPMPLSILEEKIDRWIVTEKAG
jgi:uncharacterized protein (DUF885 family)